MAVAYDTISNPTPGTGNLSWTHSTTASPKGVVVYVIQNTVTAGNDQVSGVTYGGVTMTEVTGSPRIHATGEPGTVHCFFLGTGIPTGNQTVAVTVSGAATKAAVCITLTANAWTWLVDTDATISSDSLANPSVTLQLLSRTCFCCIGFHSGQNAVTGNTALSGWTESYEFDFGTQTCGVYRYNTIGSTDVTAGYTSTAEDAAMIALAISEAGPAGVKTVHGLAKTGVKTIHGLSLSQVKSVHGLV